MNLACYIFSNDELKKLKDYSPILEDVDLSNIHEDALAQKGCGVYFWLMKYKGEKYKIYIGRTNSLKRRIGDYKREFQIHSPNDFKLRFFQEFIHNNLKNSCLVLYFLECSEADCKKKETEAIKSFRPLLNERSKTSDKRKTKMQQAFKEYYEEVFLNKLGCIDQ